MALSKSADCQLKPFCNMQKDDRCAAEAEGGAVEGAVEGKAGAGEEVINGTRQTLTCLICTCVSWQTLHIDRDAAESYDAT